jgi:hypothetical protein
MRRPRLRAARWNGSVPGRWTYHRRRSASSATSRPPRPSNRQLVDRPEAVSPDWQITRFPGRSAGSPAAERVSCRRHVLNGGPPRFDGVGSGSSGATQRALPSPTTANSAQAMLAPDVGCLDNQRFPRRRNEGRRARATGYGRSWPTKPGRFTAAMKRARQCSDRQRMLTDRLMERVPHPLGTIAGWTSHSPAQTYCRTGNAALRATPMWAATPIWFGSGRWLCDRCGSNVGRTDLHDAFHDRVEPPPSAPAKQPQIHEWTEDQ